MRIWPIDLSVSNCSTPQIDMLTKRSALPDSPEGVPLIYHWSVDNCSTPQFDHRHVDRVIFFVIQGVRLIYLWGVDNSSTPQVDHGHWQGDLLWDTWCHLNPWGVVLLYSCEVTHLWTVQSEWTKHIFFNTGRMHKTMWKHIIVKTTRQDWPLSLCKPPPPSQSMHKRIDK